MTEEEFNEQMKMRGTAGKIKFFLFGFILLVGIIHGIITFFQLP